MLDQIKKNEKNDTKSYHTLTIESSISSLNHAMNPRCGSLGRKRRVPSCVQGQDSLRTREFKIRDKNRNHVVMKSLDYRVPVFKPNK